MPLLKLYYIRYHKGVTGSLSHYDVFLKYANFACTAHKRDSMA